MKSKQKIGYSWTDDLAREIVKYVIKSVENE